MAKYLIKEETLTDIADAIRSSVGSEEKIKAKNISNSIDTVYYASYDKLMRTWWDSITDKGTRTSGIYLFSRTNVGDIEGIEKMPYPIVLTSQCNQMFQEYKGKKLLPKHLLDLTGIKNKYDNSTVINGLFSWWTSAASGTTTAVVPDYGIPAMSYYNSLYYKSTAIETVEILRCHENTQFTNAFEGATNLKNIIIEGVIGQNISFGSCPLSVASIKNIIKHLKDYTTPYGSDINNEFVYTLTIKESVFESLKSAGFDDTDYDYLYSAFGLDRDTAEMLGFNDWSTVIGNLKWNLTLVS